MILTNRLRRQVLESRDGNKRLRGVEKLAHSRDPQAVAILIEELADEEAQIRARAATLLAEKGDRRAVDALAQRTLVEQEPSVLESVTDALVHLSRGQALPGLVDALEDHDAATRQAAARTLRHVCWSQLDVVTRARVAILQDRWSEIPALGTAAIAPLAQALRTATPVTRREAARVLSEVGDSQAMGALIDVLRDTDLDRDVRCTAAWGIRRVRWAGLLDQDAIVAAILLSDWSGVRRFGDEAVGLLLDALRDELPETRRSAIEQLGRIDTRDAVTALANVLADTAQDLSVRETAVSILGGKTDPISEYALVKALADDAWCVRQSAGKALEKRGWLPREQHERILWDVVRKQWDDLRAHGDAAIPTLREALKFHAVGPQAAAALVGLGEGGRQALLAEVGRVGANRAVREIASMALAEAGDERAIEPLRTQFEDPDMAVRVSAVWALERLGWEPSTGAEQAVAAIAHNDWDGMRRLGITAIKPLLKLVSDDLVSTEIVEVLAGILNVAVGRVSTPDLRKLAQLDDTGEGQGNPSAFPGHGDRDSDCHAQLGGIRRLAGNELRRRGIIF